jgi:copper chaperone
MPAPEKLLRLREKIAIMYLAHPRWGGMAENIMITLEIKGMTCGHCVRAVTEALQGVPGVGKVLEVDLQSGKALIEGTADPAALVKAVEEEGYKAKVHP